MLFNNIYALIQKIFILIIDQEYIKTMKAIWKMAYEKTLIEINQDDACQHLLSNSNILLLIKSPKVTVKMN